MPKGNSKKIKISQFFKLDRRVVDKLNEEKIKTTMDKEKIVENILAKHYGIEL